MTDIDAVYREYFTDVYKYLISLCRDQSLAEELTQETFFRALKNLDRFRGESSLYTWLCQIGKNAYYDYCRKHRHQAEEAERASEHDIAAIFADRDEAIRLHRIVHDLPEPFKEVFSLRTFGELPFAQIGELFGKTESWARVTYHRAKLKIREEIK
ncbi:MAG: RNA polymerase sigma factor [Clostridia bacterium]|nr:RNA polymerase sigma factor [Clostridia bacterium]